MGQSRRLIQHFPTHHGQQYFCRGPATAQSNLPACRLEQAFGFLPVSGEGGPKSVRLDRILQTTIRSLGTKPPVRLTPRVSPRHSAHPGKDPG